MYKGKNILAIIPARGGSKGLPGKNIKKLCGKPLIGWTIEAAKASHHIDTIAVSTDSQEIADVVQQFNLSVPFLRPAEFALDTSTTLQVVEHAIDFYKKLNVFYDYIVLLEPTSPLREKSDIDNMIVKLIDNEEQFDSIISLGEVKEHPSIVKKITDQALEPFCSDLVTKVSRRQDNIPAYFPYGVCYMIKTQALLEQKTFYAERSTYYFLKRYQNYEIDDVYDFLAIENIMKHEWGVA